MVRRVFVDTAWNSKTHACYDPDEDEFFEVDDLRELIGKYDEVCVDSSLFPNMWPQLKALIDSNIRVFYFAWPWKWRRLREKYASELKRRFGRKKTDYGDAYILSKIQGEAKVFIEVTPLEAEFKPLLMVENALYKGRQRLNYVRMLGVNTDEEIKNCEERLMGIREKIVERAREKIPGFMEIARELGLSGNDVNALSALAGLLIYLKWPYEVRSTHRAIRYLGLYRPTREDMKKFEEKNGERCRKRYNGNARRYLVLLTIAMLNKEKNAFPPRAKDEKEVLRRLLYILKTRNEQMRVEGQDKSPNEACNHLMLAPVKE